MENFTPHITRCKSCFWYGCSALDWVFLWPLSFAMFYCLWPSVVAEWLELMFRIREVPGSNLGSETGYPVCDFSWFLSVPPGKFWDKTLKVGHSRFLPHPFQFIVHLPPLYWYYIVWVTEKESLNIQQTNYRLSGYDVGPSSPALGKTSIAVHRWTASPSSKMIIYIALKSSK
jgi:hypothetical protein